MDPDDEVVSGVEVRTTDSIARAGDWSLVLHSAAIPHRIEIREAAIVIVVKEAARTAALASLEAFDLESLPVVRVPAPDLGPSSLGLALAVLIVALHVAVGTRRDGMGAVWFLAGSASAEAIVHGEWGRAVTALMLHADVLHLLGNVVGSLVFVSAVGRWLGVGLGGAMVLASAVTGNLLTAYVYRVRHVSVGASTATFAALGVVAGLQMVRRQRHRERGIRGYPWLPLAAGLGLIVMIGSGERADLVAHLAGLGAGVVAGWLVAAIGVRVPGTVGQVGLAALTLGVIAASWLLAFRAF